MNAAIPLTYILDKLADLLPLNYDQLSAMTSKQLRDDVAKILGIAKAYQLKKAQLLDACWDALENVRNQLQADQGEREQALITLSQLKKNEDYLIPVAEVASKIYGRLREIAHKGTNLQEMKEAINGVVVSIARTDTILLNGCHRWSLENVLPLS
jgi:lipopolysaccharide biosynthesis regulator YciM